MVESNCGRRIQKGRLYGLVDCQQLYNLLQCQTLRTLNRVYKGLLINGTNYLKRIQLGNIAGDTNLLATTSSK